MTWSAAAPAKINLGLMVSDRDQSGLHRIRSLAMSIDWRDELEASAAEEDRLEVDASGIPSGRENLVWRAVEAARQAGADRQPLAFDLTKRIPAAAGLAGGSADAAAALLIVEAMSDVQIDPVRLGAGVGADVPFCLQGGLAWLEGYGEQVTSTGSTPDDHVLAIVVPPFEMRTEAVYNEWDRLGGPTGPEAPAASLPPSVRTYGPLRNDLYPAAAALAGGVDDWRGHLINAWDRPVLMTGSGPSLFAFFVDRDEAEDALSAIPAGARDAQTAAPYPRGAHLATR